jgi:hypothetical protein
MYKYRQSFQDRQFEIPEYFGITWNVSGVLGKGHGLNKILRDRNADTAIIIETAKTFKGTQDLENIL